jgi:CRP/FNR family transcriptional regulator, nitrogen fixation regulation protein
MLSPAVTVSPLPHKPDFALPLRGQPADSTSGLGALGIAMSFGRNMEVYAEGEPAVHIYKVISGVVRISKLLPDGRRQISAFHTTGDMFGFEPGDVHHASAEAVGPVKVVAYKWHSLLVAGVRSVGLVRDLLNLTMIGLRNSQEHLLLLGRKNALERVAAFLLDMAKRTSADGVVELAMPRHDIADYLGLTLETVSRMFAELKEQGAIRLEGARRVHLLDLERLAAMGA